MAADINFNTPSAFGAFGAVSQEYSAGEVIDVEWCVSADHGGVPMFRLCDDASLVAKITTPGYLATEAELQSLEQCFQRGLLRCDSVAGQDCGMVHDCDAHPDWEACADEGQYLHCRNELGTASTKHSCKNTADACAHGTLAR